MAECEFRVSDVPKVTLLGVACSRGGLTRCLHVNMCEVGQ